MNSAILKNCFFWRKEHIFESYFCIEIDFQLKKEQIKNKYKYKKL